MLNPNTAIKATSFIQEYFTKTSANNPYQYAGRATKIAQEYSGF